MKNTMKKLMIALAAAGLVGSVWAGGCGDGCLVYDLKVTLKTLGPKLQKCKSTCADDKVYYLDTVTRALKGYAWSCDYDCDCSGGNTKLALALWEPKAELGWWLYDKGTKTADQNIADLAARTIRFAKKGSKAAVWFDVGVDRVAVGTDWSKQCANSTYKVESTLRFVGFGTAVREKKNLDACIVKSVSGNVIGDVTPDVRCAKKSTKKGSWCEDSTTECCADYDIRWACLCNCNVDWCDDVDGELIKDGAALMDGTGHVPAYGTWSMKYNASLSSPKSKVTLTDKLPKYAQYDSTDSNP